MSFYPKQRWVGELSNIYGDHVTAEDSLDRRCLYG